MKFAPANVALRALLLLLLPTMHAPGAVLELTSPSPARCVTDARSLYTLENGALRPILGTFSLSPPWLPSLEPRFSVPAGGESGQLVRVYVASTEQLDSVTVELARSGGARMSRAVGFRVSNGSAETVWAALIGLAATGLPATGLAEDCTLKVTATAGSRSCLLLRTFHFHSRQYVLERIGLSSDLTALRTSPDPRKAVESRLLARILAMPHPDAVYETDAFAVPLPGARRTAGFGDRREYRYSDQSSESSIHAGVDIASPIGTPVTACGRGRVVFSESRILTGNTVVIEHLPGLFSLYYHLAVLQAREGEVVERGQAIGTVGMTGLATGPHLHWEVQALGTPVNPDALIVEPLLDKNPVFPDIDGHYNAEGR